MSREDWIILRGGPNDGWVYDLKRAAPRASEVVGGVRFTYEPTDEYEAHEDDGLPVQVYRARAESVTGEATP